MCLGLAFLGSYTVAGASLWCMTSAPAMVRLCVDLAEGRARYVWFLPTAQAYGPDFLSIFDTTEPERPNISRNSH